jgi:uncharacterized membrane protein YoaK (UPF0700 family)
MFVLVIALARLAGAALRARRKPALPVLLAAKVFLLLGFFVLAVAFGPFANADSPIALLTGCAAIAAMAVQNAVQRVHLGSLPPTTLMTGSTTQVTIDAVDLVTGADVAHAAEIRARFGRLSLAIVYFAAGCATSALLYWLIGFWGLAVPVAVGAAATMMRPQASA